MIAWMTWETGDRDMLILRDMRESDIEDYVRWFTTDTDWMRYDAPWEHGSTTAEDERESWTAYYRDVKALPDEALRWKFEIERDGRHIGWVCRYTDLEYMANPENIPAVGIDIPEVADRGIGSGTEAMRLFLRYLKSRGFSRAYTQTWSGNTRMLRVAEKLGFTPVCRMKDHRTVDGRTYDALTLALDLSGEEWN